MPELLPKSSPKYATKAASAQYSIYVYHHKDTQPDGYTDWEKTVDIQCPLTALRKAERLYSSYQYKRVEIKKRCFSKKYNCFIDKTIRVFDGERQSSWHSRVMQFLV